MRLIFIGPPGAGKGTQAARLATKWGIPHISTGDMFRAQMKYDTAIGREIKGYMDRHEFVPDDLTLKVTLLRLNVSDCDKGFILDGFPRTLPQGQALQEMLDGLDAVVCLNVSDDVALARAMGRGEGRADDTPEVFRKRLADYRAKTGPLIPFYDSLGLAVHVDGSGDIDTTHASILGALP